jgi:hypothetical protein
VFLYFQGTNKKSMSIPAQTAKHLRDVFFGGNWTAVNLKDTLADVNWQQATTPVYNLNTIATLVYHAGSYYMEAVSSVLRGDPLTSNDKFSFAHPPIHSQADWENILSHIWEQAETFAQLIEKVPEDKLWEDFADPKYGNYYRNLHGFIEHLHYHLGQIVLVKKLLTKKGVE